MTTTRDRLGLAVLFVLALATSAAAQPAEGGAPRPVDPPRSPPARNPTTSGGNLTVDGMVTGGWVNAMTGFSLGGDSHFPGLNTFLREDGSGNLLLGLAAGWAAHGGANVTLGDSAGSSGNLGDSNTLVGDHAGYYAQGSGHTFVGQNTGYSIAGGVNEQEITLIGAFADGVELVPLTNASAIGAHARVTQSNSLVLGGINGVNGATADTSVGIGTGAPLFKLHVIDASNTGLRVQTNASGGTVASFGGNGTFFVDAPGVPGGRLTIAESGYVGVGVNAPLDRLDVNGVVRARNLGGAGGIPLCWNFLDQISFCSSSLRYKRDIAPFRSGLDLVNQLAPISFTWIDAGVRDVGLGAEDVERIEPLLVTRNQQGEVEGVKYDRVAVVLINAVKEQQAELEAQSRRIAGQQQQIDRLRALVCGALGSVDACRP